MTGATPDTERWRRRISEDLWGSVVPFWMEHNRDLAVVWRRSLFLIKV